MQQGVRLTIDPGVQVYANTTNSSIIVHGEIHSLGTASNPVFMGVNPSVSWTYNSGYWQGIRGQNPSQGNNPLVLQNTTISGLITSVSFLGFIQERHLIQSMLSDMRIG